MSERYVTAGNIANLIGGTVIGNPDVRIYGIALRDECKDGYLTYINDICDFESIKNISFGAVMVSVSFFPSDNRTYIITPYSMYEKLYIIVQYLIDNGLYFQPCRDTSVGDSVLIDRQATLGKGCVIGNNTVIEAGVRIGDNVVIGDNCTIRYNSVINHDCEIGCNTVIDCCAVIGKDSIEMCCDNNTFHRVPSVGKVIIGDNVEIDANSVIERGTIGNTVIGSGTKIDSLVRIGHEAKIGENCKIVSMTAIAGWALVGSNSVIYGQCGVANHVKIGEYSTLMARSGVTKSVADFSVVSGFPAQKHNDELKLNAFLRKIYRTGRR